MDPVPLNQDPEAVYALSEQLLGASQQESFPYEYDINGRPFLVFANVFSPKHLPGAETFSRMLPFVPGIDFLEIGPGTGAVSVFAALAGARRVVAVDINPDAVANTRANAEKHGVADRVDVREGDVFGPLEPGERFDLIFWNFPFGYVEPGMELTPLQRSTLDPGYEATRRYVAEGPGRLEPGGLLTLGFSETIGRLDLVERIAAEAGLVARVIRRAPPQPQLPMTFELIELAPRTKGIAG
ncbi:MAG TPA: methyltransferase domain-containing protein [Longimicrobium sp.]|jgi:methylase of polypeptide subunit release factors